MAKRMKQSDKVTGQVYETTDLDKFKSVKGNRVVSVTKKLQSSIERLGVVVPIKVNKRMEVIDGQHRLHVARKLGIPIKYIFDDNSLIDIAELNSTSKSWRLNDYIHKYAEDGKVSYKQLENLLATYPELKAKMSARNAMGYLGTRGTGQEGVKEGTFKFKNYREFEKFAISFHKFVISTGFKSNQQVQGAYFILYVLSGFNEERFIKKAISRDLANKLAGVTSLPRILIQFIETNNSSLGTKSKNYISYVTDQQGDMVISNKFNKKLVPEIPPINTKI